jgi:VCBS repeat-containing protein
MSNGKKAAISDKVAAQTGAAKTEMMNFNESQSLDIFANDPGSAKLVSLNAGAASGGSWSSSVPVNAVGTLSGGRTGSGEVALWIQDGDLFYSFEPWLGTDGLDTLNQGVTLTFSFDYRIQMANGAHSIATKTVIITGENDLAEITDYTPGDVYEDGGATQVHNGRLKVIDKDFDEDQLEPINAGTAGMNGWGWFEVQANGEWTYTLNNDLAQDLADGETREDWITVTSKDGTDSKDIYVTIHGADEPPPGGDSTPAWSLKVQKNKVVKTGEVDEVIVELEDINFVDGLATVLGFTANDDLSWIGALTRGSVTGEGDNVTILFTYKDGGTTTTLTVVLVGAAGLTEVEIFS